MKSIFSGLDVESLPLPDKNETDSHGVFVNSFPLLEEELKTFCREKKISTSALTSAAFSILLVVGNLHKSARGFIFYNISR